MTAQVIFHKTIVPPIGSILELRHDEHHLAMDGQVFRKGTQMLLLGTADNFHHKVNYVICDFVVLPHFEKLTISTRDIFMYFDLVSEPE